MKIISPSAHSVLDYLSVLFMACAPSLFGFGGVAATLCYVFAAGYLLIALMTNTPLAPIHLIPFRVHGSIEIFGFLFLLAAPWLFRFHDQPAPRNLFVGMAVVTFVVFLLTDWRESPAPERHRPA